MLNDIEHSLVCTRSPGRVHIDYTQYRLILAPVARPSERVAALRAAPARSSDVGPEMRISCAPRSRHRARPRRRGRRPRCAPRDGANRASDFVDAARTSGWSSSPGWPRSVERSNGPMNQTSGLRVAREQLGQRRNAGPALDLRDRDRLLARGSRRASAAEVARAVGERKASRAARREAGPSGGAPPASSARSTPVTWIPSTPVSSSRPAAASSPGPIRTTHGDAWASGGADDRGDVRGVSVECSRSATSRPRPAPARTSAIAGSDDLTNVPSSGRPSASAARRLRSDGLLG